MFRPAAGAALGVAVICVPSATAAPPSDTPSVWNHGTPADLATVLADPRRGEDRSRDAFRHPAEVLRFCDVRPGMTVGDYMSAGGFYTRILVPWLGRNGR